ncbi:MAG: hypothetical protein ACYC6A_11825 [Armatimonadota bacterium]
MSNRHSTIRRAILWLQLVLLLGCLLSAGAQPERLTASAYHNLVSRLSRCLKLPEATPEERALKIKNLTETYTFADRLESTSGVSKRAREMWNSMTGREAVGGIPRQAVGGSAGTLPRRGYRPRLLDLYANWKAASLSENQMTQRYFYTEMLVAFPPVYPKGRIPSPYKSPIVYALVADARWHLGNRVEETLLRWLQYDGEAQKRKTTALRQLQLELKVDPPSGECNTPVTDRLAHLIAADAEQVKAQLAAAVPASVVLTGVTLVQRGEVPAITGTYDGMAGRLPLVLWIENDAGETIGSRQEVQPGERFSVALDRIGAQSGVAHLCWGLRQETLAAFLQIQATNRAREGIPYQGAARK